jgi:hypothetical protein
MVMIWKPGNPHFGAEPQNMTLCARFGLVAELGLLSLLVPVIIVLDNKAVGATISQIGRVYYRGKRSWSRVYNITGGEVAVGK